MQTKNEHVQARALDATELADLISLKKTYTSVVALAGKYHRERALMFRKQWQYLDRVGGPSIAKYAADVLLWTSAARKLSYALVAQVLTNIYVYQPQISEEEKKARHARVTPVAKMLDALDKLRDEHEALSDDDFVDWYNANRRQDGILAAANPKPKDDDPAAADNTADNIASILNNVDAKEVGAIPGLTPGTVAVYVARGEGETTRLVRMDVPPAYIAGMTSYAPAPLSSAPSNLLFWRQLVTVGEAIIPDGMSSEPEGVIAPDDEVNSTTPMKSSLAMYMVGRGRFSIASARNRDTMIVEVEPRQGGLNMDLNARLFLNNTTRKTMSERLTSEGQCAGFVRAGKKGGIEVASASGNTVVKFKHHGGGKNGQLKFVPVSEMRTAWTYEVTEFEATASFTIDEASLQAMQAANGVLTAIAKTRKPTQVEIAVTKNGGTIKNGTMSPQEAAKVSTGTPLKVKVESADFIKAISGLLDAKVDALTIRVDARGLVAVEGSTPEASFRVFIQTLRDDGKRSRTLIQQITSATA